MQVALFPELYNIVVELSSFVLGIPFFKGSRAKQRGNIAKRCSRLRRREPVRYGRPKGRRYVDSNRRI